jgi:hypothetical protein
MIHRRGTGRGALSSPLQGDGRGTPWPKDLHGLLPGVMDERKRGQGRKGGGRCGLHGDGGRRWHSEGDADARRDG